MTKAGFLALTAALGLAAGLAQAQTGQQQIGTPSGAEEMASVQGDAEAGAKVFNQCKACHTVEPGKHKIGPSLHGVVGRTAGSVEGFKYSPAMKNAQLAWTPETLDKYLADPKGFIPGNKMAFAGLKKPEDRANVIAFLAKRE